MLKLIWNGRWEHLSGIEYGTIALLYNLHGATHSSFSIEDTAWGPNKDSPPTSEWALEEIQARQIDRDLDHWLPCLLSQASSTLRRLCIGRENYLVAAYKQRVKSDEDLEDQDFYSNDLAAKLTRACEQWTTEKTPIMTLDSLRLIAVNVIHFMNPAFRPIIAYDALVTLRIESCLGLNEFCQALTDDRTEQLRAKGVIFPYLKDLAVRAERVDNILMRCLKTILVLLQPLRQLFLLLEGHFKEEIIQKVLNRHGQSLQSLIWDEREASRSRGESRSIRTCSNHLRVISKRCPRLEALGVRLIWSFLTDGTVGEKHDEVSSIYACVSSGYAEMVLVHSKFGGDGQP